MTATEFAAIVRRGSDKLRADDLVLSAGELEVRGKGMLRIGTDEILLDMTLDPNEKPPSSRSGVWTRSDFWLLRGIIEDCLGFRCDYVGPMALSEFESWGVHNATLTFHLNPIDLAIVGWDAMTRDQRNRLQKSLLQQSGAAEPNQPSDENPARNESVRVNSEFRAELANVSLPTLLCKGTECIERNPYFGERRSGRLDTIVGEIENHRYALIQQLDPHDVIVYLESKDEYSSSGEAEDWKHFYAFMNALAFTLGIHSWPYRTEYWRDGKKLADRITPSRRLPRTVHTPFRLHEFDFPDVISRATAFFHQNSILSREAAHILFLFRQAADHDLVHGEITLLAACVLFESLVNQIFKGLSLDKHVLAHDCSVALFSEAKVEVCRHINEQAASKGEGYRRLHRYISSAQLLSFEGRFRAVVDWFALKWDGDMELVYQVWREARHPIVHGADRAGQSELELKNSMLAESRIAGALNILFLKLIGYSGPVSVSAFEGKYRQV